jgi:hypothetical protein
VKVSPEVDERFRQITPLILIGVLVVALFEPFLPGAKWLAGTFGDNFLLRLCIAALVVYVMLLWGEAIRLHTILTGVLSAFRKFDEGGGMAGAPTPAARNPKARLEAAKLLLAAMRSEDAEARETGHRNLVRLAGEDLGKDPAAWQAWIERQARG